jgi:CubicO group peptidase (beta-lactamase class C family)
VLVGAALEAHTGQAWEALMNERLFAPLGMSHCGFGAPPHPENAQGHSQDGTPRPGQDNTPMLGPAGTVHCSLESWGRFLSANLAGPKGESSLLDASLWNELHQLESGYAMGWIAGGWYNRPVIGHDGSNTLWYSRATVVPDKDRAYGITTNIVNTDGVAAAAIRLVENDAIPLTSGVAYSFDGCSHGNDEQKYCFELDTESTLDVAIAHEPFDGQLILEHYDEAGNGLGQTVGGATGVSLSTDLTAGRYVVRVFVNTFSPACPAYEIVATRRTP